MLSKLASTLSIVSLAAPLSRIPSKFCSSILTAFSFHLPRKAPRQRQVGTLDEPTKLLYDILDPILEHDFLVLDLVLEHLSTFLGILRVLEFGLGLLIDLCLDDLFDSPDRVEVPVELPTVSAFLTADTSGLGHGDAIAELVWAEYEVEGTSNVTVGIAIRNDADDVVSVGRLLVPFYPINYILVFFVRLHILHRQISKACKGRVP